MKHWNHAIISGGASGIGLGIAERLLRRGTKVSILGRSIRSECAAELDKAANQGGGTWHWCMAEISDDVAVVRAVIDAIAANGNPDLAINSAGVGSNQAFADMTPEHFRQVIGINLIGSFNFAAAVLPHLATGSRLALVSSLAGFTSNYGYAAYGSSKFGVIGLATTLRYEYEPIGVGISCICPPEVKTPLVTKEYAIGNPISLQLKQLAGSMDLEPACDSMMAGIDAGQWLIVPGTKAKVTAFAARHLPGLFQRATGWLVRRVIRAHQMRAA